MPAMKVEQSLMALERYIDRKWREAPDYGCESLTYTEYDYLETVSEQGSIRLSDLAELMRVSKPTASNMVSRLQRKKLVTRSPCPNDGRAANIEVSETGKELLAHDRQLYSNLISELLKGMTQKDQNQLEKSLARMVSQTLRK